MAKKQELRAIISADDRKFLRVMGRVKRSAKIVGAALAGGATTVGFFAVREALAFNTGLAEVNTIADLTEQQLKNMGEELQKLSRAFGLDARDAVKGLYQALSAGQKEDPLGFLAQAAKLANVGVTTLEVSVDALTTVMNAYGDSAGDAAEVSDKLFTVVREGKITLPELAEGIGRLAPVAKVAGVSLTLMTAVLGTLVKVLKPEIAMTAYAAALSLAAKQGVKLMDMVKKFEGADLDAIMAAGITRRAATAIATLGTNYKELARQQKVAAASSGLVAEKFKDIEKTPAFKLRQVKAGFQTAGIQIGEAMIKPLSELADNLNKFLSNKQQVEDVAQAFKSLASAINATVGAYLNLITWLRNKTLLSGIPAGIGEEFATKGRVSGVLKAASIPLPALSLVGKILWPELSRAIDKWGGEMRLTRLWLQANMPSAKDA